MKTINRKQSRRFDRDLLPALRSVLSESLTYDLHASWVCENNQIFKKIKPKYLQFFASPKTFDDVNSDGINCLDLLNDKIEWLEQSKTVNDKVNTQISNSVLALRDLESALDHYLKCQPNSFNFDNGLIGIFIKEYQAVLIVSKDKYGNALWSFEFFSWSSKFDESITPEDNEIMHSDLSDPEELNSNLREYFDALKSDDTLISSMANEIDANKKRFLNQLALHPTDWYYLESDVFGIIDIRRAISDELKLVPAYLLDPRDPNFTYSDIRSLLNRFGIYDKALRVFKAIHNFYKFMEGEPEFVYNYETFNEFINEEVSHGME